MLLLRTERLPEGPDWLYALKLDGYRALAARNKRIAERLERERKQAAKKN